jgi:AraC family transcriptional regulator
MSAAISGPTLAPPSATLLRRVDLHSTVLTSTAYAPRFRLTPHAHVAAFLLFVRNGAFVEHHGRASERCEQFTCIYRPAYDEHANAFEDDGAVLTAIDLSPAWLARLREAGFDGRRFSIRSPLIQQYGDRLDAELRAPDSLSELVIESLATEVIAFVSRDARKREVSLGSWPERARRVIEDQFASPLSLAGIAAEVGVHPVHLARRFRATQGCTVGDYIRRVRVAFARRELVMTDRPIAEIAQLAGFFDQSQLTKTFKRVTGRTPAAYRAGRR